VAESSTSSSVPSSSAEEDYCSNGVVGAAEVGGAEGAAGSETMTGVKSDGVGRTEGWRGLRIV